MALAGQAPDVVATFRAASRYNRLEKYVSMALAKARGSRGGHTNPVTPSMTSSRSEPTSVHITGRPKLYARKGMPL